MGMTNNYGKTFLIDFDGTCVVSDFPNIIDNNIWAIETLKELVTKGHKLCLFTCRTDTQPDLLDSRKPGMYLQEAVNWFKRNNIPLYGIQENPDNQGWHKSQKPMADYIIDDRALGCPTIKISVGTKLIDVVDWFSMREILYQKGLI